MGLSTIRTIWGATKYGVMLATLERPGLDITEDSMVDVKDVHHVTQEMAADIFKHHYFVTPRICDPPEPLYSSVFDMKVNAGQMSIRLLQQFFYDMRFRVPVDGTIGPQAVSTSQRVFSATPHHLSDCAA
jgi:lysozyme family protein